MSAIDDFATSLLEEAKRFLENADDADNDITKDANLHAALMLGFCSLEAHINAISEDFVDRKDGFLSPHDQSILFEKECVLEDGEFVLTGRLKIYRLEDRVLFLHRRFLGKSADKQAVWWAGLLSAISLRNQLTHPKQVPKIKVEDVKRALEAIIGSLDTLYRAVYKEKFPPANRGLLSGLNF
jgi:hypothetical protein